MTGTGMERATRSAVRWRVPVSVVGTEGSGTRCTLARAMRLPRPEDDRAIHLGQLAEALRAERRVEQESAGADGQHVGPVAEDEQRAHLGPHDAFDPVA